MPLWKTEKAEPILYKYKGRYKDEERVRPNLERDMWISRQDKCGPSAHEGATEKGREGNGKARGADRAIRTWPPRATAS
jgi:hypothetical protein